MRVAHIDGVSGLAGDMLLGALLDAGLGFEALREAVSGLGLGESFELEAKKVVRAGIAATKLEVRVDPQAEAPRTLAAVCGRLEGAGLSSRVRQRAEQIFAALAAAEAKVHGQSPETVHFHEVGAIDALVDVVGVLGGLERLGIEELSVGPLVVGRGELNGAHGALPAPGPATLRLLEGFELRPIALEHELVTPTGAAIVRVLCGKSSEPPPLVLEASGYGAGRAEFEGRPNVVRVWIGKAACAAETAREWIWVLETQVDDLAPELIAAALERALAAGALDAFWVPCGMKKGRPGAWLQVFCRAAELERLERLLFEETGTLGVRRRRCERRRLARAIERVELFGEAIEVKLGWLDGELISVRPEFERVRALSLRCGRSVREVYERAAAQARRRFVEPAAD